MWRTSAAYVEDLFLVSADIAAKAEGGDETIGIAAEMLFSGASLVFVGVSRRVSVRIAERALCHSMHHEETHAPH